MAATPWLIAVAVSVLLPCPAWAGSDPFRQAMRAMERGDDDRAISQFTEAIRLNPKKADAYLMRGVVFGRKGEYGRAIADFTWAARLDPKAPDAYAKRGLAHYLKGEDDQAIRDYTEAIRLDPRLAAAYRNRANAYARKGDHGQALADYADAIRLDPKDPLGYYNRGNVHLDRKDYDRAAADHTEAIRIDPKLAPAYLGRGVAFGEKGEYGRAATDFQTALRLDPKEPYGYNNLAWLWATCPEAKIRDGKRAVEYATKACEMSGWKDPFLLGTLAAAHAEVGDYKKAVKWQKKAMEFPREYGKEGVREGRLRLKLYEQGRPYRQERPAGDRPKKAARLSEPSGETVRVSWATGWRGR